MRQTQQKFLYRLTIKLNSIEPNFQELELKVEISGNSRAFVTAVLCGLRKTALKASVGLF